MSSATLAAYIRRFAVALTVGGLFAAGGSWLAWRSVTGLPTDAQMRAIVEVVYPDGAGVPLYRYDVPTIARFPRVNLPDRAIFGDPDGIVPGFVEADLSERNTDLAAASRALADDGWRVGGPDGSKLTAARDGWRLVLDGDAWFVEGDHSRPVPSLLVERRPTIVAVVVSVLAWLVGGVFGWFKPDRLTIGFVGPALLAFNTVIAASGVIRGVVTTFGAGAFRAPWETFEVMFLRPMSVLGVALLALALLTSGIRAATGRPAPTPRRR